MRIGLAVKQMDIQKVVGENPFSIGIDGFEQCVWMHKNKYNFKTFQPQWSAGDVIGIYVDFVNRSVIFGINTKIIELDGDPFEEEFIFSILPCHVAVSFCQYQQCYFNFDCKSIPQAFLNKSTKLASMNNNIIFNSSLMTETKIPTFDEITINGLKNQSNITNDDQISEKIFQKWEFITSKINFTYIQVQTESNINKNQILDNCEYWRSQVELIFKNNSNLGPDNGRFQWPCDPTLPRHDLVRPLVDEPDLLGLNGLGHFVPLVLSFPTIPNLA
ncbi:RING finger and SPRY domain-containing protein 1, partial [Tyrophagus putrescentiae]